MDKGQYEEECFCPRGEDWCRKHKEHERAVCADFDPAEHEVTSNSVGSVFAELIEHANECHHNHIMLIFV